jgi:hypothetical protein
MPILIAFLSNEAIMDMTGRYQLPLLMPSQAQKHVTHNEALTLLDALVHPAIKTFTDTAPPPGVEIDDAYYVGPSATGDWFGQSGTLAIFTDMGWRFAAVRKGMTAMDLATDQAVVFDGSDWHPLGDHLTISNLPLLGINTAADSANRLSVRSNAALFNALDASSGGTGDVRLAINKETAADTGSYLFQTGFSGRAELGLAGDDDFHVKVSPDGSNWNEAITINRTSGLVTLSANSVGNSALADVPNGSFKGRVSAGSGDPQDLTGSQATALLDPFTAAAKGLAPASGGGTANFLRADGAWAAPSGASAEPYSNFSRFYAWHDCIAAVNSPDWTVTVSGTGAAHSPVDFADANSIGALRLVLGTVATNRGSIGSPTFTVFQLGQGIAKWASRIRLNTVSDPTNSWVLRSGFIDSATAESVDGVFFRYAHGVAGGNFQAVTRSNNVETVADTGVTAAINTTYKLEIEINAAGTNAEFRINGIVVATANTNIPAANGRELGYGLFVLRSAGTASVNAYDVDYLMADLAFAATR